MTGFIAVYEDGSRIKEINDFFDHSIHRNRATNWHLIDQSKIIQLELWWRGYKKVQINKPNNHASWIFHHTGSTSIGKPAELLSRSVGFIDTNNITHSWTVEEKTGRITRSHS